MTILQKRLLMVSVIVGVFLIAGIFIWSGTRSTSPTLGTNTTSQTNSAAAQANANFSNNSNSTTNKSPMTYAFPGVLPENRIANKQAVITTAKGTIEFTLNAKAAPKSVSNFVYLAEQGFYDGLTFHRVEPGFVIQGGDPSGNGTGGPGYKFDDEPVQGEYVEGAVAMANSGANTNGSQFFITLADVSKNLPKQYNLFGQVTKGLDVVQRIAIGDVMQSVKIVSR